MFGTIAMFEAVNPSYAFRVETSGRVSPSGHSVRYPSEPLGTTVAFKTYPEELAGSAHEWRRHLS